MFIYNTSVLIPMRSLLLAILLLAGLAYSVDISSCDNITSPGVYNLTADLTGAPNSVSELFVNRWACIKIASSDVIFDCGGHSFDTTNPGGSPYLIAIAVNQSATDNVTIKNCPHISGYNYGVLASGTDHLTITGMDLSDTIHYGFYLTGITNSVIEENTVDHMTSSTATAFYIGSSDNVLVQNNNVTNSASANSGFSLVFSNDMTVENNRAEHPGLYGFDLSTTSNTTVRNNYASYGGNGGFRLQSTFYANNVSFINNTAEHNLVGVSVGCSFSDDANMVIDNNTLNDNNIGINVQCYNVTVNDNTIDGGNTGIYAARGNARYTNNVITGTALQGMWILPYDNVLFTNNTIANNLNNGITLAAGTSNNVFTDDVISNNPVGIEMTRGNASFQGTSLYDNDVDLSIIDSNDIAINLYRVFFTGSPYGGGVHYTTTISLNDSVPAGSGSYNISWADNYYLLPPGYVDMYFSWIATDVETPVSIDEIAWHWSNTTGPEDENFTIIEYDGTNWGEVPADLDTSANTLTVANYDGDSELVGVVQGNACPLISASGTYIQDTNYLGSPHDNGDGTETCVKISASNVVYDCNGYQIRNDGPSTSQKYGVTIDPGLDNVTIKNCAYIGSLTHGYGYNDGIHVADATNVTIENTTAIDNNRGIYLNGSIDVLVTGTVMDHNDHGIYIQNGHDIEVRNTELSNNDHYGIYLFHSGNPVLLDNLTVHGNGYSSVPNNGGIGLESAEMAYLSNSWLYDNSNYLAVIYNGNVQADNVIFDSPAGLMDSYVNVSFADSVSLTESYKLSWKEDPYPAYPPTAVNDALLEMTDPSGPVSIDQLTLHYVDSQISVPEAELDLWERGQNGNWILLDGNHDVNTNELSALNVEGMSHVGIFEADGRNYGPVIKDSSLVFVQPTDYYILTNEISPHNHSLVIIDADDVLYDCNGHSINFIAGPGGVEMAMGLYVTPDSENVTIRNCIIGTEGYPFDHGIYVNSSYDVTIENTLVNGSNENGVIFENVTGATVDGLNASNNNVSLALINTDALVSNSRLYGSSENELTVSNSLASPVALQVDGLVFDSPAGSLDSYTTLSFVDDVASGESYKLKWRQASGETATALDDALIEAVDSPNFGIDQATLTYTNSQLAEAGIGPNQIDLWEKASNGNWILLNGTGNVAEYSFSTQNLEAFTYFGLFDINNNPNAPVIRDSITFIQPVDYVDMNNEISPSNPASVIIDADGVVYDCNGHGIDRLTGSGSSGGQGIYVVPGTQNVVIKNCNIGSLSSTFAYENGININASTVAGQHTATAQILDTFVTNSDQNGVLIRNVNGLYMDNLTAPDNNVGLYLVNSDVLVENSTFYSSGAGDILVDNRFATTTRQTTLNHVIIDNDAALSSAVNISVDDLSDVGEHYAFSWSPDPVIAGTLSLNGGLLTMTSLGGSPSLDSLKFHWTDYEAIENQFKLWDYDMSVGWILYNSTPDTTLNELGLSDMGTFTGLGIFQDHNICPIISTPGRFTQDTDYDTAVNHVPLVTPACVVITSPDVTYDCAGHTIYADAGTTIQTAAIALKGNIDNVTIENCNIQGGPTGLLYGIYVEGGDTNVTIRNNTIHDTVRSIFAINSEELEISDVAAYDSGDLGLVLFGVDNVLVDNFTSSTSQYGIYLLEGTENVLINNYTASDSSVAGIYLNDSNLITIQNSRLYNNTEDLVVASETGANTYQLSNVHFAGDATGTNHTIISITDVLQPGEGYEITSIPYVLHPYYTNVQDRSLRISSLDPGESIDTMVFEWTDEQAAFSLFENDFAVWKIEGGWEDVNDSLDTPVIVDTASNTITVTGLNESNRYSVVEAKPCVDPRNNLWITEDVILCEGEGPFYVNDTENNGLIRINAPGVTVECNNTVIIGDGTGKAFVLENPANGANIIGCNVSNYDYGVYRPQFQGAIAGGTIRDNIFTEMDENILYLPQYSGGVIQDNVLIGHSDSHLIYTASPLNNIISYNYFEPIGDARAVYINFGNLNTNSQNRIHHNVFNATGASTEPLILGFSENNSVWMNEFYGRGIELNPVSVGMRDYIYQHQNYCVNGIGNAYFDQATMSGRPLADCGPFPELSVLEVNTSYDGGWTWEGTQNGVDVNISSLRDAIMNIGPNNTIRIMSPGPFSGTYQIYFRDNVTLDCNGAELAGPGGRAIYVLYTENFTVMNCNIHGYDYNMRSNDNKDMRIIGNTFSDATTNNLLLAGGNADNVRVIGNYFGSVSGSSPQLSLQSPNSFINNNIFQDNGTNTGISMSSGSLGTPKDNRVTNNVFNMTGTSIRIYGDSGITGNTIWANDFIGKDTLPVTVSNPYNYFNYSTTGNYWRHADSQAEGCIDWHEGGPDGICDDPISLGASTTDPYAQTHQFHVENDCGEPITSDTNLTGPVLNSSGGTACPQHGLILYPGVTLDCDGNSMNGTDTTDTRGVHVYDNATVTNCVISGFEDGIRLDFGSYSHLVNNELSGNSRAGIYLTASDNNTIIENTATDNQKGIWLFVSESNTLEYNDAHNNYDGIYLTSSNYNTGLNDSATYNDNYGLVLNSSINNKFTDTDTSNNVVGTYIDTSNGDQIDPPVSCYNTESGYVIRNSVNVVIDGALTCENGEAGVEVINSTNTQIINSQIVNNSYGSVFDSTVTYQSTVMENNTYEGNDVDLSFWDDIDADGVPDGYDKCDNTVLPESVPSDSLKQNHYACTDDDYIFETSTGDSNVSLADTYGCTCEQILYCKPGGNNGEHKFGCSPGTMEIWIAQTDWAPDCQIDGKVAMEGEQKSIVENTDNSDVIDIIDADDDNDGIPDVQDSEEDSSANNGKPDWWCEEHPSKC